MVYVGLAGMFDWGGRPNRKSHAMTTSNFFEKKDFLWDKDIIEWRIRSWGLGWYGTWSLLKDEALNQKLKRFSKLSKLGDVVSKPV